MFSSENQIKAYIPKSIKISDVIAYVFSLPEKTDIRLYFCCARWRHCKRYVCNCVALKCLFVASRVTE